MRSCFHKSRQFLLPVVAIGLLLCSPVEARPDFPAPAGYVNDFASVLDEAAEAYLETFLQALERETSAEVALVTVTSLDGMTIEEYAQRLFASWGIGKQQDDNGVLVLVAPSDRAIRIEVGYGLEHVLPDGLAGEIIRTEAIPEFKNGNYPRGMGRTLNRIAQGVRHPNARVLSAPAVAADDGWRSPALVLIPFAGVFVAMGSFAGGVGLATRTFGLLLWGVLFASIPLVMTLTSFFLASMVVLVPLGLIALVAGYRKGHSPYWTATLRGRASGTDPDSSGWVMGATSGSPSGGSSDSGGSSSDGGFGGGSSGGGGASGHW